ncbi:MAG TPA: hypothetical protein VFF73_17270 [Planctomycetota bacterium]|nr:hypothetical protein [Planctomycetota bacterium]
MTSKRLKVVITLLLLNTAVLTGYVVALRQGVALPVRLDGRSWNEVLPDVVFLVPLSFLAAYSMSRRRTWGFAIGMVSAGAYLGSGGPSVARFVIQLAHVGAVPGAPAGPRPDVPFVAIYSCVFGIGLAIYLWTRRHVFAVGV